MKTVLFFLFVASSAVAQISVIDLKPVAVDVGTKATNGPFRHSKISIDYGIKNEYSYEVKVTGGFAPVDADLVILPNQVKTQICPDSIKTLVHTIPANSIFKWHQELYKDVAVAGGITTVGTQGCFAYTKGVFQEKALIGLPAKAGSSPTIHVFFITPPVKK